MKNDNCSIVFVGVGIKFFSHVTQEGLSSITQSSKILYLLNEPASIEWLEKQNSFVESLDSIYFMFNDRFESYKSIANKIIEEAKQHKNICVVMYGHPIVLNMPTKLTVDMIKHNELNIDVAILPGISAENVLYCDLQIDPGTGGMQSYEATEFIEHKKKIDITSHLILWQVGFVGYKQIVRKIDNKNGLNLLKEYLLKFYEPDHTICLYEAAQYPHIAPKIIRVKLVNLHMQETTTITTMYIKPINKQ